MPSKQSGAPAEPTNDLAILLSRASDVAMMLGQAGDLTR